MHSFFQVLCIFEKQSKIKVWSNGTFLLDITLMCEVTLVYSGNDYITPYSNVHLSKNCHGSGEVNEKSYSIIAIKI